MASVGSLAQAAANRVRPAITARTEILFIGGESTGPSSPGGAVSRVRAQAPRHRGGRARSGSAGRALRNQGCYQNRRAMMRRATGGTMPAIHGRQYGKDELRRRVGSGSQLAGGRLVELADGRTRGVRAAEVWTGSGFRFLVLLDRGMDIGAADDAGRALAFLHP